MTSLNDLRPGEGGRILGLRGGSTAYQRKLLSLGLTPGTPVEVVRFAPFGDPIEVRVRGTAISLRRAEALLIEVERSADREAAMPPSPFPEPGVCERKPALPETATATGPQAPRSRTLCIGLIGNPNCGKTTVFNALTGARHRVGNWPGVTVERKTGRFRVGPTEFELIDLPGTYALDVADPHLALDERIARDFIHSREADLILNVLDAANLERHLYLSLQLIEMGHPLVIALNMMDVAQRRGIQIDHQALAKALGRPVVPIVATTGQGMERLKETLLATAIADRASGPPPFEIPFDPRIESLIETLAPRLQSIADLYTLPVRWLAVRLLEGDDLARRLTQEAVSEEERMQLLGELQDEIEILIADARYRLAHDLVQRVSKRMRQAPRSLSDRIDRVVLHRLFGIPIFLLVMYLMFVFTIQIGGAFTDFFDLIAGALFVDGVSELLRAARAPDWSIMLLAQGLGGGIQVVATFIPIIAFLYLFISALEDSGYMARAAFVMDRLMRAIGLPGKSFVPLLVGFGCNVPAIMATRTLDHPRDRILTALMAPFMSCGARLPVYTLFAAAFFADSAQNLVFALYLTGILAAILTGWVLKHTLLQGQAVPFVMELPPYHLPRPTGVLIRTWERTQGFVRGAGRVIVPMVLVINVLNGLGPDGTFGNENTERSVLAAVGRTLTPAFAPMGLHEDNWPATVGILTGVLAKEAVVGTLDATYAALAEGGSGRIEKTPEQATYELSRRLVEAFATIPHNLAEAFGGLADPLGLGAVSEAGDTGSSAEPLGVSNATFGVMAERFDGPAGAFAYLLLILLYMPCVAALGALQREIGSGWALFAALWTTVLGYATATVFYQAANFTRDPMSAALWIGGMLGLLALSIIGMRLWVQAAPPAAPLPWRR